jgi:hypothetical protein
MIQACFGACREGIIKQTLTSPALLSQPPPLLPGEEGEGKERFFDVIPLSPSGRVGGWERGAGE